MPVYEVRLLPSARRELADLPARIRPRADAAIRALADNPRPHGSRKLAGSKRNLYRIHVAVYRVVYEVRDEVLLVVVVRVRHRRDAYRLPFPSGSEPAPEKPGHGRPRKARGA